MRKGNIYMFIIWKKYVSDIYILVELVKNDF